MLLLVLLREREKVMGAGVFSWLYEKHHFLTRTDGRSLTAHGRCVNWKETESQQLTWLSSLLFCIIAQRFFRARWVQRREKKIVRVSALEFLKRSRCLSSA